MCGIYGYIAGIPFDHVKDEAEGLASSMRHRGPDGYGYHAQDPVGVWHSADSVRSGRCGDARLLLGQTRLAIIDLSPDGLQPMTSPDGRYRIVFNGEIYNYLELRAELEALGEVFSTRTDTEVLLRAYIRWGSAALNRFVGMFAFAIHDAPRDVVFCARDCFGIKPFYYAELPGRLVFSSEIDALLRFKGVSRTLNYETAFQFLRYGRSDYGPETMMEGLMQLPPAHFMEVSLKTGKVLRVERYWSINLNRRSRISFEAAAERLKELLMNSVRIHLRSDVPVGVTLSGGIDSSTIACLIRKLEPDMPIRTFSYVADTPELSEEKWTDLVNGTIRAESNKVLLNPEEMIDRLDRLIQRQGEPFGSTSIYAQARVFELARERGVVVTLDGQGADEIFGGYTGHPKYRALSLLCSGHPVHAVSFLKASSEWPGRPGIGTMLLGMAELCTPDFLNQLARAIMRKPNVPSWIVEEAFRSHDAPMRKDLGTGEFGGRDRLRAILAYQTICDSLPNLLRYGDRNAMTVSLEARVPFITREIVEFAFSLPEEYLIDNEGRSKAVLRAAARGLVPDAILDRRDKIGFRTPEANWFVKLDSWVQESISQACGIGILNVPALKLEWENVKAERSSFDFRVWRWLNFIRWMDLFRVTV